MKVKELQELLYWLNEEMDVVITCIGLDIVDVYVEEGDNGENLLVLDAQKWKPKESEKE